MREKIHNAFERCSDIIEGAINIIQRNTMTSHNVTYWITDKEIEKRKERSSDKYRIFWYDELQNGDCKCIIYKAKKRFLLKSAIIQFLIYMPVVVIGFPIMLFGYFLENLGVPKEKKKKTILKRL